MRKTKIICTIGPASRDEAVMRELFEAGMNVGRFNFSHGSYDEHEETIRRFRSVRDELGVSAAVMLDTKGPEIRVRTFEGGSTELLAGQHFVLTTKEITGNSEAVSVTYNDLPGDVKKDDVILMDDGKLTLRVLETSADEVKCAVLHGGILKDHKWINVPDVMLSMDYLSDVDKSDLLFGIENGVDYVAASFIRNEEDVRAIRTFLDKNGGNDIRLIAKIENTQGVENFEKILKLVDGIMVARGDMGVEIAYEKLPVIQKRFIRRCVQSGKIVITATQMLESMMNSPMPTRAEITDVANAVFDGTSAVMLSGETAAGAYPAEAVRVMARIAVQAESDTLAAAGKTNLWREMDVKDITNAVGHAASTLADDINARALLAVTQSGFTARRTSKFRPNVEIIGATPTERAYHQLSLEWGVQPLKTEHKDRLTELFRHCADKAVEKGMIQVGDLVVITAGVPIGRTGDTNMIRVMEA